MPLSNQGKIPARNLLTVLNVAGATAMASASGNDFASPAERYSLRTS
jgi:hypothetical protein